MNVEEARARLREVTHGPPARGLRETEAFCQSVLSELPRNGETGPVLVEAYEWLIELRVKQGRMARALRLFNQYVEDCAPECDQAFDRAYQDSLLASETSPVPLRRRMRFHSLVQLLRETLPLKGFVAECGCARGLSSYLLCSTLKSADSAFDGEGYRIFDSFQGLSEPQADDAVDDAHPNAENLRRMMKAGHFAMPLEDVRKALSPFPRVEFYPGWIPEAFPDEPGARYRFVHLDVDLHQPTWDSLEYFLPRLLPGGKIVCDDYGWPGARKAIDEFCARTGTAFTTTPHYQAVIVRDA